MTIKMTDILPDQLRPGLRVVFCGTAAGTASALRGAYFAGPGNRFWPMLAEIGLTPRQFLPEDFRLLDDLDIGLTDIAKKVFGADVDLCMHDFDVTGFKERVRVASPDIIAFNGKKAASVALGCSTRQTDYGLQKGDWGKSKLFVLPSTSGSARRFWDSTVWFELAQLLRERSTSIKESEGQVCEF